MIYYRVKPEYDNKTRYKWNNRGQLVPTGILIGNELYTSCEFSKIANRKAFFTPIQVSKRKVYWSFGARFEQKEEKDVTQ